jgi:hypothetical protein
MAGGCTARVHDDAVRPVAPIRSKLLKSLESRNRPVLAAFKAIQPVRYPLCEFLGGTETAASHCVHRRAVDGDESRASSRVADVKSTRRELQLPSAARLGRTFGDQT